MIIQCESCSKKFVVKDSDIPEEGRNVQCGYCSFTWHQKSTFISNKTIKLTEEARPVKKKDESLSVDSIKASDGKTYKFLGSQSAQLLPSGKTGLFAKKKISKELDRITGRKIENIYEKRNKKIKKEVDPSSQDMDGRETLSDIYKANEGLGFFGFVFLLIIIGFSIVGILKTFETDLISRFPEMEYVFIILEEQLIYVSETVKNIITILDDLINSYY